MSLPISSFVGEINALSHRLTTYSQSPLRDLSLCYLTSLQTSIHTIAPAIIGKSAAARNLGTKNFFEIKKVFALLLVQEVIQEKVKELSNIPESSFSIFGFSRLFMRQIGSLGTDIDCMLVVDTDNLVIDTIRHFFRTTLAPRLQEIGIAIETSDYLLLDLHRYKAKLSSTKHSLFTLSNVNNVFFLAGSQTMMKKEIFFFTDDQLVLHLVNLLTRQNLLPEQEKEVFERKVNSRLENENGFRNTLERILQKLATFELYVAEHPFNQKPTIHTIFQDPSLLEKRKERSAPFPLKLALLRFVDTFHFAKIDASLYGFSPNRMAAIETLGIFLSNIVCGEKQEAALTTLHKNYSSITLEQIKRMTPQEMREAFYLMDCQSASAEALYDKLWELADLLRHTIKQAASDLYREAKALAC